MRRHPLHVVATAALALAPFASCQQHPVFAAQLAVRCTAPSRANDGSCAVPVLVPMLAGNPVRVHFAWTGPSSGQDSIATIAGAPVSFLRNVPAGTYSVRAWASDSGGVSCDTTITVRAQGPPWKVAVP